MHHLTSQTSDALARWHLQDARCCTAAHSNCILLDKTGRHPGAPPDNPDLIKAELAVSSPSLYLKHDLDAVLELQEYVRKGRSVLAALYTYRSVAKPHFKAVTGGNGLDGVLLQPKTYQAGLTLASSTQQFCAEAGEALIMIFVGMVAPDGIGVNSSQAVLRSMTMLFDQLHVLDTLKSAKVSLTDDIAMARQAYQQTSSSGAQPQGWEEGTDFDGLLEFMEDPWSCVKQVHSCIKQVNYQHRVVARLVQYICDSLLEKENGTPQVVGLESHAFLRALPVALYLLFPSEDGKLGLEAIGSKQLHRGLKLLKQKPVIPAIGDLPLPLMHILHQLSAFLVAHGQENKEGILPADQAGGRRHAAKGQQYDLQSKTAAVVADHDAWAQAFASYAVQMDDCRMTGRTVAPQLLQQGLMLATEGLQNVSTWSAHIRELHSWKLSHTQPQPLRRVNVKPAALPKDHTLRQQFSHQSSMQVVEPEGNQWTILQQQQQLQPVQGLYPSRHIAPSAADSQALLQMTSSPQVGMQQSAGMPATPIQEQQPTGLPAAPAGSSTQQLSPSQRRAQSSSLFAAVAAATSMPSSQRASEASAGYPTVVAATTSDRAAIFASPAAQAARAYTSPEPSPQYPLQSHSGSAGSPTVIQSTELAASPISPEVATQAAIAEMRSLSLVSATTDAKLAQTGTTDPPATMNSRQDFEPVPVVQSAPRLCSPATAAPVPTSIPTPTSMSTTVSLTAVQEPPNTPIPEMEPIVIQRSLVTPAVPFQPAALPVTTSTPAPPLRPVSAFSYTAPAATHAPPLCTDRYIPAIGYSPSRARVARDPPADAVMGHIRKQSFAGSSVDALPALPQQAGLPWEAATATILSQEAAPGPTASARSIDAAAMGMGNAPVSMGNAALGMGNAHMVRATAQFSGAVYGPGVASTPLAQPTTAITTDTTYSHPVLAQSATTVAPMTVPGDGFLPHTEAVSISAVNASPMVTAGRALEAAAPTVLSTSLAPSMAMSTGAAQPDGTTAVAAVPVQAATAMPVWANTAQATGASVASNPGINLGPLQEGQTLVPGPVAEGVQSRSEGSATDNWSDTDSDVAASQLWHGVSAAGPVCEGVKTNSDVWSDSASSDPGSPLSASQPVVSLLAQPTKQSRFGKLLSRAKGSSGSGAAASATAPAAAENNTEAAQPSGEAAETQLPAITSSAAVPARTGMRSMLFGKTRRQASSTPLSPAAEPDNSAMTNDPESASNGMAVSAAEGFSQEQVIGRDGSTAWQTRTDHFSDDLSQSSPSAVPAAGPVPGPVPGPGPAVFAPSSSAMLTTLHSPGAAFSHVQLPEAGAGLGALDPLSHQFEERMLTENSEAVQTRRQSTAPLPEQYAPHADQLATTYEHGLRARSPSPSDAPSFDPLTATLEEFEAFNRSHQQRLSPELSEQFPGQLLNQSSGTSDMQLPQQLPAAASIPVQPHKTRSIPSMFRLRKTAPSAGGSSSPDVPLGETAPLPSEAAKGDSTQPGTGLMEPRLAAAGPEQAASRDKPRSKPFGLLRKRSKGTAQLSLSQQPAQADPASPATAPSLPREGIVQELQQAEEPGPSDGAPPQQIVGKDAEEKQHVNTVLGLSAGLTSTFGSFMAASSGASPRGSPGSPHQLPEEQVDPEQALSSQSAAAAAGALSAEGAPVLGEMPVVAPSATWSYSEAVAVPPIQSNDEDGSSFDAAAPLPFSDEQEASVVNMDAAASASKPQHDDMTAVSAESSAAGLAVDDVNVDVLGTGTAVVSAPSASAEAFRSIWKMLSLKQSKPAADPAKPDLEAVQRQVSAQQALSRQVSEPAVIEAANDDQVKRSIIDDTSSSPQQAAGLTTVPEDETSLATGLVQQPSIMAKGLGFFSSLRRGSMAAEGSSAVAAEMFESSEVHPEQSEEAVNASSDQLDKHNVPAQRVERAGSIQSGVEHVTAALIELPPVFEYGSDNDEAQNGPSRSRGASNLQGTSRVYEVPVIPSGSDAVQYPSLAASDAAEGYAAYPEVSPVLQLPEACQQTELFMDYYSDVSRYDYQPADLECMLEILACIHGVACLLQQADTWLSGYLCQAVHLHMQSFVQLALTHMDSRNKDYSAVHLLHTALGSPSMASTATPTPSSKGKTFQKAKSLLSFRHQGSTAATSSFARMLPSAYPAQLQGEQQFVQQVAPTFIQLLTLQYTAEQLVREETGKKQWMKSVMDTESAFTKELKRFLCSSQSWEPVLDLSSQCQQAADMSYLWLKEIHLENTLGSHSQPLIHSVPWLLANHALVYTHQRHIEVAVLPLEVYNYVQQLAAPALGAPHFVAEASPDAELCLRKLINNLAAEAFVQYKTAAANDLTDWAFVKGQCQGALPTSGVLRQFEELFRQHDLVVLGHSVDLSSAVATHMQGLLNSNAQYLVSLCEASDVTALVAVEGQVAILQRAHSMLSSHLELDQWAQIWAAADGQQGFDSTTSRVAHAVASHIIGDLLPNFAYCEPTQRFTRLAPRQAPIPEPEADLPAFAFGPGGSVAGSFSAWAAAHQNWFGMEHLSALVRLSGPSGIAMVVRAVTHQLGLFVQKPLLSALRPLLQNFPQLLLRAAHSGSPEAAAGLFGQLQYQVQQMLMLRSDWQAALPTLTQIGNGSALLTCLDSMLGSHADRAFMQAAPLLGITLGTGGHLQCLDEGQLTPLGAALREAPGADVQAETQQAEDAAWQTCSMSSLLPHFLHSLQQALQSSLPELDYGPIKFCHAWSVLMFALASVDPATAQHKPVRHQQSGVQSAYPGAPPMQAHPQTYTHHNGAQQPRPVELSSYGEGLLSGAALLLHLLNQTAWFKLTDLSSLVVQRQQLEYKGTGSSVQSQDFATFVSKAQAARVAVNRTLSMLSTLQPKTPQSVSILTSTGGPTAQYAPDHCAFAMPRAQTKAVLMPAQAQQDLAGQSTLTEQVTKVHSAVVAAPITDGLAMQTSRGFGYAKGPMTYSVNGSRESDSNLIPAANMQWLQADQSRSSLATSIA